MNYYDETAEGYNELHGEEQLKKLRIIANEIKTTKDTKLLDVGCGTGLSAKVFDCNITGIDPAEKLLEQAPFKTIKAKAESLPFEDNEFDVVIAVTSIHNFGDIEAGLKEIKRVGKDKFALTVLKKANNADQIIGKIKEVFQVEKEIDENKDKIFILKL
ncbi:class I SAM-dependent methyltransferase [Candidatus Woesearchaeota archaeon]|nr:class I SAM-dependent methyltransferase [Candidatus Woesearchaeota archaeon]MBW3005604.1 class I SAM-dependent methyltransferase [Candidatus Woesearchaeota archaeon]